jgi:hypothetical protein
MATNLGGAPLSNQNARQHGLYSQKASLPPAEQIAALRAAASAHSWSVTANLIAKTASIQSPREIARTLRRLTLAYNALNRLVRAQLFAPAPATVPAPGFGFPNPPAPCPSFSNHHAPSGAPRVSTISNPWSARFPFVHPIVFNLTHLLFGPRGLHPAGP